MTSVSTMVEEKQLLNSGYDAFAQAIDAASKAVKTINNDIEKVTQSLSSLYSNEYKIMLDSIRKYQDIVTDSENLADELLQKTKNMLHRLQKGFRLREQISSADVIKVEELVKRCGALIKELVDVQDRINSDPAYVGKKQSLVNGLKVGAICLAVLGLAAAIVCPLTLPIELGLVVGVSTFAAAGVAGYSWWKNASDLKIASSSLDDMRNIVENILEHLTAVKYCLKGVKAKANEVICNAPEQGTSFVDHQHQHEFIEYVHRLMDSLKKLKVVSSESVVIPNLNDPPKSRGPNPTPESGFCVLM